VFDVWSGDGGVTGVGWMSRQVVALREVAARFIIWLKEAEEEEEEDDDDDDDEEAGGS
jgi:hypothetical protein